MRRYWVPLDSVEGDEVSLTDETLHHIRDVCRMHMGSKFEVIVDGTQKAYLVEIVSETKKESRAKILETREIPELPRPHLHVAISVPRFAVFEAVVEKAVELGVKSIHPFFSDYSFIRTQTDVWDKKIPRFEKIVQSATQQSGRGELMTISKPLELADLLSTFNRIEGASGLFAYEGDARLSAKDGVARTLKQKPREAWVFVGSEGGFSEKEVELFQTVGQSKGLTSVTLGRQVLRVETACVALISILKYDLDLMR